MTAKETFLRMGSYEEFDEHREELCGLEFDQEVLDHISNIFPKCYGGKDELYKTRPQPGKRKIIGR